MLQHCLRRIGQLGPCRFSGLRFLSESPKQRKRLDVAVVGLPNAGKSQLVNVLTHEKVAAVSRKRHTTREGILGARTIGDTQLVFVDTPGFLRMQQAKEEGLDRDLVITAAASMENVDFSLLVVDAARKSVTGAYRETLRTLMQHALRARGRIDEEDEDMDEDEGAALDHPLFGIVLNKSDLIWPKEEMLNLAYTVSLIAEECLAEIGQSASENPDIMPMFFYVSALKERGTDDLIEYLLERATPCHSWEVEDSRVTNMTPRERAEEVIREKLYRCLHKEVPHSVQQVNRLWKTSELGGKPLLTIHQDLVVRSKSHREIVRGTGGRTVARIQDEARKDLSRMFACDVALQLHVKLVTSRNG